MIGEFLSKITLLHTAIIAVVCIVLFGIVAYKKPSWYENMKRIFFLGLAMLIFLRIGWNGAIEYHHISYEDQTKIPDNFMGVFWVLFFIDMLWFDGVVGRKLEGTKKDTEAISS